MVNVVEISEFRKKEYWLDYYEKPVEEKGTLGTSFSSVRVFMFT